MKIRRDNMLSNFDRKEINCLTDFFTLKAAALFNSTRKPWYKYVRRSIKMDTLGYIEHSEFRDELYPIYLIPDWDQIKETYLSFDNGKTPYDIFIDTRVDKNDWDTTPVIRLGTVFISQSEEVDGNEQSLLEDIMSKSEIQDSLYNVFNNLRH